METVQTVSTAEGAQVGVWAPDPITRAGLARAVARCTGRPPCRDDDLGGAQVVVLTADRHDAALDDVITTARRSGAAVVWVRGATPPAGSWAAAVLERDDVVSPRFSECLHTVLATGAWAPLPPAAPGGRDAATTRLSERELAVLRCVAEGYDTAEIARATFFSERTVKNVVSRAVRRTGGTTRAHAVALAIRAGLL